MLQCNHHGDFVAMAVVVDLLRNLVVEVFQLELYLQADIQNARLVDLGDLVDLVDLVARDRNLVVEVFQQEPYLEVDIFAEEIVDFANAMTWLWL